MIAKLKTTEDHNEQVMTELKGREDKQ